MLIEEHGYVGNIWVRQNYLEKAGDKVGGHVHLFDHVSLLAKGSVSVKIDNKEPVVFHAPTFIVIRKDKRHEVTALEDGTSWYCVFAARDLNGDVTEVVHAANDPWFAFGIEDDFLGKARPIVHAKEKRFLTYMAALYDSTDLYENSSYTLHRVKPVTEGTRYSLVAWISGPPFK